MNIILLEIAATCGLATVPMAMAARKLHARSLGTTDQIVKSWTQAGAAGSVGFALLLATNAGAMAIEGLHQPASTGIVMGVNGFGVELRNPTREPLFLRVAKAPKLAADS